MDHCAVKSAICPFTNKQMCSSPECLFYTKEQSIPREEPWSGEKLCMDCVYVNVPTVGFPCNDNCFRTIPGTEGYKPHWVKKEE